MKPVPLWSVTVTVLPEAEEAVAELLNAIFGQPASAYTHLETGLTAVTVYLCGAGEWSPARRAALAEGLETMAACGLRLGPARIAARSVRREDWAESWKRHFKPLAIGSALLIRPSWSRRRPRPNQAVVVLDPGLSFGTGQHPTTSFCLRQLVARRQRGTEQSFLDIGTGSGILAIAAAKLGFSPVDAFDFDPEAVRVARANARQNGEWHRIRLQQADVRKSPRRPRRRYSVVCANLIANLLLAERDRILARLEPNGVLVTAGILKTEFGQVQAAYEAAGLRLVASRTEKEWRSGSFVRKSAG